jgi:hypothetical protein
MQKYLFKVGPIELPDGRLLPGIVDFFEEGAAAGKGVLELIGNDVAAFCDDLVKDAHPMRTVYQESLSLRAKETLSADHESSLVQPQRTYVVVAVSGVSGLVAVQPGAGASRGQVARPGSRERPTVHEPTVSCLSASSLST